jgi:hypothetical protein
VFVLSRNAVTFGALALGATLPLALVRGLEETDPALYWLVVLAVTVVSALAQAAMANGTWDSLRGHSVDLRPLFQICLSRSLPVIALLILCLVAIVLGIVALVVPAFIAMTVWFVAPTACVVEQAGPIASLKRSARLTKGHRWKIFGVVLVLVSVQSVPVVLVFLHTSLGFVARPLWDAAILAAGSVLGAVIYHDLRVAKEGRDTDRIGSVFE